MTKRINLFTRKEEPEKSALLSAKSRYYITIIGILLFVVFLVLSVLQFRLEREINDLTTRKENNLKVINSNSDLVAKLRVFNQKSSQLNKFMAEDTSFLPYFTLLKDDVSKIASSSSLQNFVIDNKRSAEFTIALGNDVLISDFLKTIEASSFLDKFSSLKLSGFNLIISQKEGYQFKFLGVFKAIKNDKNI